MPSLWKNKRKGNKISQMGVEFDQLTPKHHEVIDFENRVSTSLNDLLLKKKDTLRKLSRKKKRSQKYNKNTLIMEDDQNPFSLLDTMNNDNPSNQPISNEIEEKTVIEKSNQGNITDDFVNKEMSVNLREDVQENSASISEINVKKDDCKTITKSKSESYSVVNINRENQDKTAVIFKRSYSEEEKIWNEIISEIDSLEQNFSVWPRESPTIVCDRDGYCLHLEKKESRKTDDNVQYSDIINQSDKLEKKRKFWKKLVPKPIRKSKSKNKKYEHEDQEVSIIDYQDQEEETEIEDMKDSSSTSSDDDDHEYGEECLTTINSKGHELLSDFDRKHCVRTDISNDFMKGLIVLIIPLIGLISGRIFAFLVTVIGCIVLHKLRADTKN